MILQKVFKKIKIEIKKDNKNINQFNIKKKLYTNFFYLFYK